MEIRYGTLNGERIAYTDETVFLVQIGKGSKGAYRTRYAMRGNLGQAVAYYNGLNIGNGYKKRLFVPTFNKPILAKASS